MKSSDNAELSKDQKQGEKKKLEEQGREVKRAAFYKRVAESDDLNDELQALVDHVAEFTGATAAYVGKVVKPIKGIKNGLPEDANDQAHHINGAKQQIEFLHATKDFQYLEEKILLQEQGVTYNLFNDEAKAATNPIIRDGDDLIPKHIFVEEVV